MIEVEDDGVGMAEREFVEASGNGIGMKLVRDRLQMIYGANARFDLASRPGRGTRISLMLPVENEGGWPPISR